MKLKESLSVEELFETAYLKLPASEQWDIYSTFSGDVHLESKSVDVWFDYCYNTILFETRYFDNRNSLENMSSAFILNLM